MNLNYLIRNILNQLMLLILNLYIMYLRYKLQRIVILYLNTLRLNQQKIIIKKHLKN